MTSWPNWLTAGWAGRRALVTPGRLAIEFAYALLTKGVTFDIEPTSSSHSRK